MLEMHPYKPFVPENAKYLLLGSFPAKPEDRSNWYYVNPRNQFWPILEKVYQTDLTTKSPKKALLKKLKMAITDIIYSCERKKGSNLDSNLINITYNKRVIKIILNDHNIKNVYFTSRFVESNFNKLFSKFIESNPDIKLTYLPSPSPRFAAMKIEDKIKIYKKKLPGI